jgi:hypothetical protein
VQLAAAFVDAATPQSGSKLHAFQTLRDQRRPSPVKGMDKVENEADNHHRNRFVEAAACAFENSFGGVGFIGWALTPGPSGTRYEGALVS